MDIPWKHSRCIVCLESSKLTKEHVIPASLGGKLTCRFLCGPCNSRFGSDFEADARLAPEIRRAASGLGDSIPDLIEKFEHGAVYKSQYGEHEVEQSLRPDGCLGTIKLADGSLIVPESEVPRKIKENLKKSGWDEVMIEEALARWRSAAAGEVVVLGAGYSIKKWNNHPSSPTYTESELNPLVPLKMAYEFVALLIGGAIYSPKLQFLRDVLKKQDRKLAQGIVSYNWAGKADAFHGIIFEGNNDVAQFQVRILGLLAYTIRFPGIAIEHPRFAYTQRLDSGKDWVYPVDDVDQK